MNDDALNTLEMLKSYALGISCGICEKLPFEVVCSVMLANNRILTAAIIENGGKLVISPESVYKMLTSVKHIAAVANEDGSMTLSLVAKEEIIGKPEEVAL